MCKNEAIFCFGYFYGNQLNSVEQQNEAYSIVKKSGLIMGPLIFLLLYNAPFEIISPEATKVIAVAAWMVCWWITEAVSISVTALIPLVLFPLLNIVDMKTVSASYGSPIVFLFFGGFVMALALEKVNLHKRIALNIIQFTGTSPNRIVLGFMLATAFLSMWISNTATTVVMLPIALSVFELLRNDQDGFTQGDQRFAISMMLGIAFAANVGGVSTIIGTPPNTVMVGFVEETYGIQISFLKWMIIGIPFSILMLAIIYIVLVQVIYKNGLSSRSDTEALIQNSLKDLGPLKGTERRVLAIFCLTMLLWVFRSQLNDFFEAYKNHAFIPDIKLSDAGISMLAAFSLFAIPFKFNKGEFTLEWKDTVKLPWGILILFGGGLALASALSGAGVIDSIGDYVATKEQWIPIMILMLLISIMLFMTELMSNVALVSIFAPVVAGIAIGLDQDMMEVLIPVTMASSCAFMLPMATPPNAIVFASGYVKVHEMAKAGFILNIISIIVIGLFAKVLIPTIF